MIIWPFWIRRFFDIARCFVYSKFDTAVYRVLSLKVVFLNYIIYLFIYYVIYVVGICIRCMYCMSGSDNLNISIFW